MVVAALAALVVLQPGRRTEDARPSLTAIDPGGVERLVIERRGEPTVRLARREGGWRMEAPQAIAADETRVARMLQVLGAESAASYPADRLDLAEVGLEAPHARLVADGASIAFGAEHPIEPQRYVRVGDTVHLIDARHFRAATAQVAELVSRRLLPPESRPVAIELPGLTLERGETVHWSTTPARPEASADAIHGTVEAWRTTRALWVRAHEPGEQSLGEVTVRLEGREQPLHFVITAREPELVLAREELGLEYHLPRAAAEQLLELGTPAADEPRAGADDETAQPPGPAAD